MSLCDFAHFIESEHPYSFYRYLSTDQRDADPFTPLDVRISISEPFISPNLQTVCLREMSGRETGARLCIRYITGVVLSKGEVNLVNIDFFTVSPAGETRVVTIEALPKTKNTEEEAAKTTE